MTIVLTLYAFVKETSAGVLPTVTVEAATWAEAVEKGKAALEAATPQEGTP